MTKPQFIILRKLMESKMFILTKKISKPNRLHYKINLFDVDEDKKMKHLQHNTFIVLYQANLIEECSNDFKLGSNEQMFKISDHGKLQILQRHVKDARNFMDASLKYYGMKNEGKYVSPHKVRAHATLYLQGTEFIEETQYAKTGKST